MSVLHLPKGWASSIILVVRTWCRCSYGKYSAIRYIGGMIIKVFAIDAAPYVKANIPIFDTNEVTNRDADTITSPIRTVRRVPILNVTHVEQGDRSSGKQ